MSNVALRLALPSGEATVTLDTTTYVLNKEYEFVPVTTTSNVILRQVDQSEVHRLYQLMGLPFSLAIRPGDIVSTVLEVLIPQGPTFGPASSPVDFVTADAPVNGVCTCLVTCRGTNLSFVKVESI